MNARVFLPIVVATIVNAFTLSGLEVEVTAEAAVLMDAQTGQMLFEKEPEEIFFPASICKVATALCVLEACDDLGQVTTAPREAVVAISTEEKKKQSYRAPSHWLEFNSSHVGIKKGEQLTVETLLYGLMLQSGNDAANVLAHHVDGDIPAFVDRINQRVEELGCRHTHFTNPHGLHHPEHVTCARDMALITAAALKDGRFRKIVGATSYHKPASNLQPATLWMQKNKLVRKGKHYYPKAIGVKTGFTQDARGTLISAAEDGERTLVAVVLRCDPYSNAYKDATALFEAAFNEQPEAHVVLHAGRQPFARGRVRTVLAADLLVETLPSKKIVPQVRVEWGEVEPPIARGSVVGEVIVDNGRGSELARAPLLARRSVSKSIAAEIPLLVSSWPGSIKGCLMGGSLVVLVGLLLKRRK